MSRYLDVNRAKQAFFHRLGALAVILRALRAPIRAFVPITAGALGISSVRFYAVNIAAILVVGRAGAYPPGVLAVSSLDRAVGLGPDLKATAKHTGMPLVFGGALIVALWHLDLRRRRGEPRSTCTMP